MEKKNRFKRTEEIPKDRKDVDITRNKALLAFDDRILFLSMLATIKRFKEENLGDPKTSMPLSHKKPCNKQLKSIIVIFEHAITLSD